MSCPGTPSSVDALPAAASVLRDARRLVVKIGSSLVTRDGRGLDREAIAAWSGQLHALRQQGRRVVVVCSGAVAEGVKRLGWPRRPSAVHELQAAAAVGQMGLVEAWERCLRDFGLHAAQVLLTHEDLADRTRYLNARSTLRTLLDLAVVPVVNENDTVATDEIRLGDNDTLGALVANLVEADALIILTDQQGLFTADPRRDPRAHLVRAGRASDPALAAMAGDSVSGLGRGGMITKLRAARRAAASGAHTVICSGREERVLERLAAGESIGTAIIADLPKLAARKQWFASHLQTRGRLLLDAGAERALREQGRSLLPVGVRGVEGDFRRGELVSCIGPEGGEVARGLVNYSASETRRILGLPSAAIAGVLGYEDEAELIHRDDMIVPGRAGARSHGEG